MAQEESPIPVIDISNSSEETGHDLVDAAARYGFVFIRSQGLGFDADIIDQMFAVSREFFRSPQAEKEPCEIGADNVGWSPLHSELLDPGNQKRGDFKEYALLDCLAFKNVFTNPTRAYNFKRTRDGEIQKPLPKSLGVNEAQLSRFFQLCQLLCLKLLDLFAIGLKIDPAQGGLTWLSSRHDTSKGESGTVLRILYYPSLPSSPEPNGDIRAGAHSDYGSLTLLFRLPDQSGLEILTPSSNWVPVPVLPPGTQDDPFPPILVNIGDLLSYWTGGLLKSTVHRVVFPPAAVDGGKEGNEGSGGAGGDKNGDRYSIAYFCHPRKDTQLAEVPSEMVRKQGGKVAEGGRILTAMEHLNSRLAATYGWGMKGEEVEAT